MKQDDRKITPDDTTARVGQVLADLEVLRLEMGRQRDTRVALTVKNALPREVYYHALTAHRKMNRLCVELGGRAIDPPVASQPARATIADVFGLLEAIGAQVLEARALLAIDGVDLPRPQVPGALSREPERTLADTLTGCLSVNRQVNAMLATAFNAREGFELLLRALGVAQRLLAIQKKKLPEAPVLERRKSPRDVFQVLWGGCQVIGHILRKAGENVVEVYRGYVGEDPTDVVDAVSVILCELDFLASFLPDELIPPLEVAVPKILLPAHNYQRGRQLQAALWAIAEGQRDNPQWLSIK